MTCNVYVAPPFLFVLNLPPSKSCQVITISDTTANVCPTVICFILSQIIIFGTNNKVFSILYLLPIYIFINVLCRYYKNVDNLNLSPKHTLRLRNIYFPNGSNREQNPGRYHCPQCKGSPNRENTCCISISILLHNNSLPAITKLHNQSFIFIRRIFYIKLIYLLLVNMVCSPNKHLFYSSQAVKTLD